MSHPDLSLLLSGKHFDPHRFLGLHEKEIRLWRPGGDSIHLEVLGQIVTAQKVSDLGLFVYKLKKPITGLDYRVYYENGQLAHDPYSFLPVVGEMDAFLLGKGCHYELYKVLGATLKTVNGVAGVLFAVWAPNAGGVSIIADFNHFDGRLYPMRCLGRSGIWELFVPNIQSGEKYKFEIRTKQGSRLVKSDPYAFYSELRPKNASIVAEIDTFSWTDKNWLEKRKFFSLNSPINIYEVHLGSWKKGNGDFPNYRDVAVSLSQYCLEMGFTHVELMPIMEHPLDESWGYQVTGFYSVTSRFGSVADFQFFVDHMHAKGIGVILDWVPAHFPVDDFGLHRFDGTALYEHEDPRLGFHPHWNTAIFNYGRKEVCNFLIAGALFWLEQMHVDGIRVDAVASMLYLDYGRRAGEWIPNPDGSNFNLDAIEFIKHLNSIVHTRVPGCLMIAEESTSYQGVTSQEGLGFDLKWNMGWMNDTLKYVKRDPLYRKYHQNELTFGLLYAFSERFICALSHDEVVHGKGSLIGKMPGPDPQKFAGVRLLYSYMIGHPGKKLLFMGGEIGQWSEWNCSRELEWDLLRYPLHQSLQKMVKDLNHLYLKKNQLWEKDFSWEGYEWVDFSDVGQSVISYLRKGLSKNQLFIVHHFTPETIENYRICLKNVKKIVEIFNTDDGIYGGSGKTNGTISIEKTHISILLSPLATMIFEVEFG
ncbi:MAG: 1,4-alpha-glucan branching protein GlgB [Chlamydiales bacterium]